jgi:hypothetical protein
MTFKQALVTVAVGGLCVIGCAGAPAKAKPTITKSVSAEQIYMVLSDGGPNGLQLIEGKLPSIPCAVDKPLYKAGGDAEVVEATCNSVAVHIVHPANSTMITMNCPIQTGEQACEELFDKIVVAAGLK